MVLLISYQEKNFALLQQIYLLSASKEVRHILYKQAYFRKLRIGIEVDYGFY